MSSPPLVALPAFLVRIAGFAFARLEPLRCTGALDPIAALDTATEVRARVGHALDAALDEALKYERFPTTETFDRAARKQLVRHCQRARVAAREPVDAPLPDESLAAIREVLAPLAPQVAELEAAHVAWRAAGERYQQVFAGEFERTREAIRALYGDDPRLLEAVFLESPEAFLRVGQLVATGGPRNSRARQRERLAAMYAQRFCAKNDTNSICGPVGVAYRTDDDGGAAAIDVITEDARRETYVSHWAAQSLLDAALRRAGEAAPITWRINPTARIEADAVAWSTMDHDATTTFRRRYARSPLPPAGVRLLRALTRPHDAAALAALAGELELEVDELREFVGELTDAGIVRTGPTVLPGWFYPLRAVAAELERWPESESRTWALGEVAAAERLIGAFATAPLAQRVELFQALSEWFHAATGEAAARAEGQHYADRSLLHEDACVEVRARLGIAGTALDRTLPTLLAALELPLELARERVREWFRGRFGDGARVSALEAHRAFDADGVLATPAATPRAAALRLAIARVRETIARAASGVAADQPARITTQQLADALADVAAPTHPGYVSVDVMLRRLAGDVTELVLGEVHGFFWLPTCLLDILPAVERDRVVEQMRAAVHTMAGETPTAECLFLHTQATDRRFPLATTDLQLIVLSDRAGSVDLGALDLRLVDGRFEFLDGETEVIPLVTYTQYPFILYTSRIAPLFDDFAERFFPDSLVPESLRDGDVPRLAVDSVVFQRRLWRRPAAWMRAALAPDNEAELFRRAQVLQRELGCGAQVFISIAGEPKPLLLDFCNVFLLESIAKLLKELPDDAVIKLSEMLPSPDELIAHGPDGPRTSELRMGFYRI